MKQFGKILKFELKYYFKNKIFVGVTVFLVLLIAGVMFFPRISALLNTNEKETETEQKSIMLIKAATEEQNPLMQEVFSAAFLDYEVQTTQVDLCVDAKILQGDPKKF